MNIDLADIETLAEELNDSRTEVGLETTLQSLLETLTEQGVATFRDAGILTHNRGLVLTLANGAEFQLTIVQSSRAMDEDESDEDGE